MSDPKFTRGTCFCQNCRWSALIPSGANQGKYECHGVAPGAIQGNQPNWATVSPLDWCEAWNPIMRGDKPIVALGY